MEKQLNFLVNKVIRGCFPGADFSLSRTWMLHHMVLIVERKMKRLYVICRKKNTREFSYRWFRRGTPGRTPTRGGGEGGRPSTSWFLLVRPSAPAASAHYGLFSWRGSLCAHRDGTEAPISSSQYQAEGKTHTPKLSAAVSHGAGSRCLCAVTAGSGAAEEEEEVGGGRRRRGKEEGGRDARVGLSLEAGKFHFFISFFYVVLSHLGY